MFYTSYIKCEARAFDHLYDPLYATGNLRDIQRESERSLRKTAPAYIYTNFDSMFSELPQRPRSLLVLQRNELPKMPEISSKSVFVLTMLSNCAGGFETNICIKQCSVFVEKVQHKSEIIALWDVTE